MTESANLGSLIRQRREAKGMSRADLSFLIWSQFGVRIDEHYVTHLENGRIKRPDKERLILIAKALELPVEEALRLADYAPEDFADVSAGPGTWTESYPVLREVVNARDVVALKVRGTSMEPEIPEGSVVFVDRKLEPEPGRIVIAWTPTGGVVKRLERRDGQLWLIGNTTPPILVDGDVTIEGVVFYVDMGRFV